ncbi:hypothetical protein V8E55_006231 [Tylopilus felleus]
MGRSAKLHKRVASILVLLVVVHSSRSCVQKKATAPLQPKPVAPPVPSVQSAKKRAGLKSKAKANKHEGDHVLGGADYVTLQLGGRRKAAEEARKLPPSE